MTTLAVAAQKGGVGKTTVALNLAYALAGRGPKTLLVDADPQGAVGSSIQGARGANAGLAGYLRGEASLADSILKTRLENFSVLTAGEQPFGDDGEPLVSGHGERLQTLVEEAGTAFDLVVFDTPSGLFGPTRRVLEIADHLLVPLQSEPLALRSITQVVDAVARLKEQGSKLQLAGFLLTMLSSRDEVSLAVAQESWGTLPDDLVMASYVPRDQAFLKASAHGVPLALLSRRSPPVAAVFQQIAAELETRLGLDEDEADLGPISLLADD